MSFLLETIRLGLSNLRLHLLRSFLTALGIILGVAAVVTMVGLGEGSKREALAQIERLGARNIIIRSQKPPESQQAQSGQQRGWVSRYGLTREDLAVIQSNFPDAEAIVPLKEVGSQILRGTARKSSQAFGTTDEFIKVANLTMAKGRYLTAQDLEESAMVCVVGAEIAKELFPLEDPLGSTMRIDERVLTVVGVLSPVGLSGGAGAALVGRDLNLDVHIPITTARTAFGDTVRRFASGSFQASEVQIAEVYFSSRDRESVLLDGKLVRRLLDSRHPGLTDIGIVVPYELLEQARKTALTWTLVLSAIAGISLLVGGIGIMNIMLATVTERTREIGIRRAVGATRRHILWQFLVETSVLSTIGGLLGVGLGIGASVFLRWGVPQLPKLPWVGRYFDADMALPTHVTLWSILLAFGVATATGLIFGVYPARRAARQDPIVALRHD
jgi:putative ABC transport system permease protein